MVRVIMTWDIQENKEKDYIEFAVAELSPKLHALGMEISDVWYTLTGSGPEMIILGMMERRADALGLLRSSDWRQMVDRLNEYVENVRVKVVEPKGPFQL
jgi:hypothetical protein